MYSNIKKNKNTQPSFRTFLAGKFGMAGKYLALFPAVRQRHLSLFSRSLAPDRGLSAATHELGKLNIDSLSVCVKVAACGEFSQCSLSARQSWEIERNCGN